MSYTDYVNLDFKPRILECKENSGRLHDNSNGELKYNFGFVILWNFFPMLHAWNTLDGQETKIADINPFFQHCRFYVSF